MKNFQILTLMIMFVMVYAASLHCKEPSHEKKNELKQLLDDILERASSLEELAKESKSSGTVTKTSDSGSTCVKGFFCLAEKALEHYNNTQANNKLHAEYLIRVLHIFNKECGNNNNCSLPTTGSNQTLLEFLRDIKHCTPQCKSHLSQCLNH